jgi:hypothetical protein
MDLSSIWNISSHKDHPSDSDQEQKSNNLADYWRTDSEKDENDNEVMPELEDIESLKSAKRCKRDWESKVFPETISKCCKKSCFLKFKPNDIEKTRRSYHCLDSIIGRRCWVQNHLIEGRCHLSGSAVCIRFFLHVVNISKNCL